jgi:hypothetical protein
MILESTHEAELFLRYRDECEEIARSAPNESQRIMLMHIADTWQRLANNVNGQQRTAAISH